MWEMRWILACLRIVNFRPILSYSDWFCVYVCICILLSHLCVPCIFFTTRIKRNSNINKKERVRQCIMSVNIQMQALFNRTEHPHFYFYLLLLYKKCVWVEVAKNLLIGRLRVSPAISFLYAIQCVSNQ